MDTRDEGTDILILARTDALKVHGVDEAIHRGRSFAEAGADIVFVEAPGTEEEMRRICREIPGPMMANMVEQGETPILAPDRLEQIGFKLVAYPLTLLSAGVRAMQDALAAMKRGETPPRLLDFTSLRKLVGFDAYYEEEARYSVEPE